MAVYKINELRKMQDAELSKKMEELSLALLEGGAENNPKKAREIRKAIARIKTLMNERKKK
ncbi:MAG: 50S ribosomal protein L29 [Candidatus Bilamarchaeaceae archaeon]